MAQRGSSRLRSFVRRGLLAGGIIAAVAWPLGRAGTSLVVERAAGPPDAIIMLASHEWERLPATIAAARQYPKAIVMLTVPKVVTAYNCHMCAERTSLLENAGIVGSRVRLLEGTTNTHAEAAAALARHRIEPFARLLVITSPYHTRRALRTFAWTFAAERVEIDVRPAAPTRAEPRRWWLDAYDRHYVRYEWAAIAKYKFQYGVPIF